MSYGDSVFEQIMKSKRSQLPKRAQRGKAIPPQNHAGKGHVEMDIRYSRLANEDPGRQAQLARILAIRKELSDIRHMKRKQ